MENSNAFQENHSISQNQYDAYVTEVDEICKIGAQLDFIGRIGNCLYGSSKKYIYCFDHLNKKELGKYTLIGIKAKLLGILDKYLIIFEKDKISAAEPVENKLSEGTLELEAKFNITQSITYSAVVDDKLITATKENIIGYKLGNNEFEICLTAQIDDNIVEIKQVRFLSETMMIMLSKSSDNYTLSYLLENEQKKFATKSSVSFTDAYLFLEIFPKKNNDEAKIVIGTKNQIKIYLMFCGEILEDNDCTQIVKHINEILKNVNLTINFLKFLRDEIWIGSTQLISFIPNKESNGEVIQKSIAGDICCIEYIKEKDSLILADRNRLTMMTI